MKIIRSRHEEHFTILPNALLRDARLSWAARGLLAELLSRPQDWQTTADQLARTAKKERNKRGEGREAVRALFNELESAGYIVRTKAQDSSGSWSTELHVYDVPQGNPSSDRGTAHRASVNQASADRASVDRASLRRTDHGSTDLRSTEEEEPSELADARSGAIASDHASDEKQQRRADLEHRWELVDQLTPQQLREALYQFEKRRPAIYRKCRQHSIDQFDVMDLAEKALDVDRLSYKYAVQHYSGAIMPLCLSKPLGVAA